MLEFFQWLFDTSGFPPRKVCGTEWTPFLIWLHVSSDLLIWLAYLSIPLVLIYFTRRRDLPYPRVFILFALFILACGTTHLIEAIIFEYPIYRFAGFVKLFTATVSWITVIALVPIIPKVVNNLSENNAQQLVQESLATLFSTEPWSARLRDYAIGFLFALATVLIRGAINPLTTDDRIFVLALLAVVFVSWQLGFGPGFLCLFTNLVCYSYFFVPPQFSFFKPDLGDQIALTLFFFCGVACCALGESQRIAQWRARMALMTAVKRKEELETEITHRQVIESVLRQREQELLVSQRETAEALARLDAYIDNAPLGIVFLDSDLRFRRINPYLAEVNGTAVEDHIGKTIKEVVSEYPQDVLDRYRQLVASECSSFTTQFSRPDSRTPGQSSIWQVTAFPVRNASGETFGAGVIAQDVTELKKAEGQLAEKARIAALRADVAASLVLPAGSQSVLQQATEAIVSHTRAAFARIWISNPEEQYLDLKASAGTVKHVDKSHIRIRYGELKIGRIASERIIHMTNDVLNDPFVTDVDWVREEGLVAFAGYPLIVEGRLLGVLAIYARQKISESLLDEIPPIADTIAQYLERRRADDALRDAHIFLEAIINALSSHIAVLSHDGTILKVNDAWRRFGDENGLQMDAYGVGSNYFTASEILCHTDPSICDGIRNVILGQELTFRTEYPCHSPTEKRWFQIQVNRFPDMGAARVVVSHENITPRVQAEEAVRESESKFRTMADSIPQLAWMTNADGYIFWYNQRWYDYTGTTFEEMKGWGWQSVHDPEELPRVLKKFTEHIASGEPWEDTFPLRRHDGAYRWHLSRAVPIRDSRGEIVRWFGTNTDVTEQRNMEQALREAAGRFQTLTEVMPQFVWTWSADGNCDYLSRQWVEYTGIPAEEQIGTSWLSQVHSEDRPNLLGRLLKSMKEGIDFDCEFRIRKWSGEYRWFKTRAVPFRDSNGTILKWVGTNTDIDDQKRQAETLEQMVRERTAKLEEEVDERNRAEQQVRAVAIELARSNEELEKFAYVASHDLQEPLRKIQAFGDRLEKKFREFLPEGATEYLDRILASAGRMRRLIDDLLSFSRVTTQARPFGRTDLREIVQQVLSDLDVRISEAHATVRIGDLPTIDADATQMRQLFQNLIANAVKFHRQGVSPVVEVESEILDLPWDPENPEELKTVCRILVKDNGIGFDETYRERIFQVFQRLHGRTEFEGTGIGLAICKKIVERHGGSITAQSEEGKGATFVINLPLNQPTTSEDETGYE